MLKILTNDGFTNQEDGKYNLGIWIFRQRYLIDKESEKGQLLRNIGMVWSVRKNKEEIQELCNENNILYELNEDILLHMSIQEFQAKLGFLRELNLPIIEENDILNPIFSMSNLNMQANYNVSLEELMDKYYAKESSSLVRKYCG